MIILKIKKCDLQFGYRQAGRHLPEFRKIRNNNKDFIRLCLNSKLLQKLLFNSDIKYWCCNNLFDILLNSYALGQKVSFRKKSRTAKFNFDIFKN